MHGHATRFGDFRKTLGISKNDRCEHCGDRSDSPEHQLFFCQALECDFRGDLLAVLEGETEDYNWRIQFCNRVCIRVLESTLVFENCRACPALVGSHKGVVWTPGVMPYTLL